MRRRAMVRRADAAWLLGPTLIPTAQETQRRASASRERIRPAQRFCATNPHSHRLRSREPYAGVLSAIRHKLTGLPMRCRCDGVVAEPCYLLPGERDRQPEEGVCVAMAEISEVDKLRQFKKGLVEVRRRTVQSGPGRVRK